MSTKRRIAIITSIMVMFVFGIVLTGCGGSGDNDLSDSKYVGNWVVTSISLGDESEDMDEDYVMTLNPDGTGTLASADENTEFKWELTDKGFKTTDGMKLKFEDDGDGIKAKILGADMHFEKQ